MEAGTFSSFSPLSDLHQELCNFPKLFGNHESVIQIVIPEFVDILFADALFKFYKEVVVTVALPCKLVTLAARADAANTTQRI